MLLIFYVGDCLLFRPFKDKSDRVYALLQACFNIEDHGYLNKYSEVELYHRPYVSIHISQACLVQRIINMNPGMDKSSDEPTPSVNYPLAKNEGDQTIKNDFNYKLAIRSLNFMANSMYPESQFTVNQCAQFSADTKILHNQAVKSVLKCLKETAKKGILLKLDPERVVSATWAPTSQADRIKKNVSIPNLSCIE